MRPIKATGFRYLLLLVVFCFSTYPILTSLSSAHEASTSTRKSQVQTVDDAIPSDHSTPSDSIVPTYSIEDLQTAPGESNFEHLIAKDRSSIPFPFTSLLKKIESEVEGRHGGYDLLMFPFGRSLQRYAAKPNYFKYPRVVVAVHGETPRTAKSWNIDLKAKLFLGYVEPSNKIEVISYNEKRRRFEFLVVENYKMGAVPNITYPPRQLCLSCHHGQGPIFPSEPWTESNDNDEIASRISKAQMGDRQYLEHNIFLEKMKERGFSKAALMFDVAIHDADMLLHNNRIRQLICTGTESERRQCMAAMFKVALVNTFRLSMPQKWPVFEKYRGYVKQFFKEHKQIDLHFPFLPDRNPFTNKNISELADRKLIGKAKSLKDDQLMMEKLITNLPPAQDPKVSRVRMYPLYASRCHLPEMVNFDSSKPWCLTSYFSELLSYQNYYELKKMMQEDSRPSDNSLSKSLPKAASNKAVNTLGESEFRVLEQVFDLMAADPSSSNPLNAIAGLTRQELMSALMLRMSTTDKVGSIEPCCLNKLTTKNEDVKLRFADSMNSSARLFARYCQNCHGLERLDYPLQFLAAVNEKAMVEILKIHKGELITCLEQKAGAMPPANSVEAADLQKKPQDRQKMIEYLKTL